MSPGKWLPCMLSLLVGTATAACFLLFNGGLNLLLIKSEHTSLLHFLFGWLLVVVIFWLGFIVTWLVYVGLLWLAHAFLARAHEESGE